MSFGGFERGELRCVNCCLAKSTRLPESLSPPGLESELCEVLRFSIGNCGGDQSGKHKILLRVTE